MTVQIALRISDELAAQVDQLCSQDPAGPSRSDVLRHAIEAWVRSERRKSIDEAIVAAYTRIPQSTPDEWGLLIAQQDTRTPRVGALLDAEDGGW